MDLDPFLWFLDPEPPPLTPTASSSVRAFTAPQPAEAPPRDSAPPFDVFDLALSIGYETTTTCSDPGLLTASSPPAGRPAAVTFTAPLPAEPPPSASAPAFDVFDLALSIGYETTTTRSDPGLLTASSSQSGPPTAADESAQPAEPPPSNSAPSFDAFDLALSIGYETTATRSGPGLLTGSSPQSGRGRPAAVDESAQDIFDLVIAMGNEPNASQVAGPVPTVEDKAMRVGLEKYGRAWEEIEPDDSSELTDVAGLEGRKAHSAKLYQRRREADALYTAAKNGENEQKPVGASKKRSRGRSNSRRDNNGKPKVSGDYTSSEDESNAGPQPTKRSKI
ncbi:hypothetical protein JCM1840_006422 [Sporobolomyces johnsonii]